MANSRFGPRLTTGLLLFLATLVVVLGWQGFARKLDSFQPVGIEARFDGEYWTVQRIDPKLELNLASGSRIYLVDGEGPAAGSNLAARLRAHPSATLVTQRGDRVESLSYLRPPLAVDIPYLILAFIGIGYFVIGLFTLWRSPDGRLFFLWTLASSVLYVFSPVYPADSLTSWVYLGDAIARLLLPPLTLHLFASIAAPARRRARRWLPFAYLPGLVLLALEVDLALFGGKFLFGPPTASSLRALDRFELFHLIAISALAVAVLIRRLAADQAWEEHRQLLWLAVGAAAGYGPFFLLYGLPSVLGARLPSTISTLAVLPLACVPLAFAYAILRYRLWDLGLIVRNGFTYTVTLVTGLIGYSLLDLVVRRAVPEHFSHTRDFATFVGGLLIAGLIVPTHRGVSSVLERFHYGALHGRRRRLARLGQELLRERSLDRLVESLLAEVGNALDLDRVNLLLAQGPALVPVRPEPSLPPLLALDAFDESVWGESFEVLHQDARLPGQQETPAGRAFRVGYRYVFPLEVRESRIGLVLAGLHQGGEPLNSEDVDLVRSLLDQAALAIENARLIDQVQRQLEQVSALERHTEGILESSPAGIVVLDADQRIVSSNLAFAALAARSRPSLLGERLERVLPIESLPEHAQDTRVLTVERGGESHHLHLSIAPLLHDEASGRRVVVLQDVTERIALERALREKDRLASLGVLAAGVAHEVNTPLTGISSYAQLLLSETEESDPRHALLKKVERQTFRASRIVNGLLDLARRPSGDRRPVDVAELLGDTADLLRERMSAKGIRLSWQPPGSSIRVLGNEGELQQVFTNLSMNAIDAMAAMGGGTLSLSVQVLDGTAIATIADDGPGIAAADLARIFEPFYTTKQGRDGTGLGLAISYSIAEQHGGRIRVASELGRGSRFSVELPLAAEPTAPPE